MSHACGSGDFSIKMYMLPKVIYRFKILMASFCRNRFFKNPKTCVEYEETMNSQNNLKREEQNWRPPTP